MTFRFAICDDDLNAITALHILLKNLEIRYDIDYEITPYNDPKKLLADYQTSGMFHAIFLDVEMPGMNGLELAHHLRNNVDKQVKIVFVSNYPQYMQDSFPTNPYDYLTKPLQESEIEKIVARLHKDYEDSFVYKAVIHADGTEEFLNIRDIYYIKTTEGLSRNLIFALKDSEIICRGNLNEWIKELAEHHFVSPHRSCLVNLEHIHFINNGIITMTNKATLPISRRQEQSFKSMFARSVYSIHRQ